MPTQERKKLPSRGPPEGSPRASPDATPTITDPGVPRYSGLINEAWNAANAEQPQARGVERFLNGVGTPIVSVPQRLYTDVGEGKVQDTVTLSDGQQTVVDTLAVPAKALLDIPQIADDITDGVNTFMEVVPVLMKALDGLANIHPFIAGMGEPALNMRILTGNLMLSCCYCIQGCLHARNDASEQRSKGYRHLCRVCRA